ncbi:MAG: tyrosine/phenylalanine carboxypeptidase domain-containing protein [Microgenomates group bacterium]
MNDFRKIDQEIIKASKQIKPLYHIEPVNLVDQKLKFLSGKIENPLFKYRELEYRPSDIVEKLVSLNIPRDEIGRLYKKKINEILKKNEIVLNRDNFGRVKKLTISLYGRPNRELIAKAKKLLENTPSTIEEKVVDSNKMMSAIRNAIKDIGLKGWRTEFSEKNITTVSPAERKITLGKNRKFSRLDLKRLPVHEVGVHMTRAANGYTQPYKIFAIGLPGYLSTEEGLAVYFEKKLGFQSNEVLRDFAGRVLAVNSLDRGLDFRTTYDSLVKYNLPEDQAWTLCVRVFRAGGFLKDHVYLKGYFEIDDFVKSGGDLIKLYVGKVGLQHLPEVEKLMGSDKILSPKFIPSFLNK